MAVAAAEVVAVVAVDAVKTLKMATNSPPQTSMTLYVSPVTAWAAEEGVLAAAEALAVEVTGIMTATMLPAVGMLPLTQN